MGSHQAGFPARNPGTGASGAGILQAAWRRGHRGLGKRKERCGWVRQEMRENWKGLKRASSGRVCFLIYLVRQQEALKDFQKERDDQMCTVAS